MEPFEASPSIPPASAFGFVIVIAGILILNREKMEWLERMRSRWTGRGQARLWPSWMSRFRLF